MIDFTKKDLYARNKRKMEKVLANVIVTPDERDALLEAEEQSEAIQLSEFDAEDEFGDFDLDSFGGFESGNDSFGSMFEPTDFVKPEEQEEKPPYEKDNIWLSLLASPYYLFYYVVQSITKEKRLHKVEGVKRFLKSLRNVSIGVLIISLFLIFGTDATFIFSLYTQALVSVLLLGASVVGDKLLVNEKVIAMFPADTESADDADEFALDGSDADFDFVDPDSEDEFDFGDEFDEDSPSFGTSDLSEEFNFDLEEDDEFGDALLTDLNDLSEFEDEPFDFEEDEPALTGEVLPSVGSPLPHSIIDVKASEKEFISTLERVYRENEKYRGSDIVERAELVKSLSGYLVANDRKFGSWDTVEERGIVYNNIMYTIYLALVKANPAFRDMDNPTNRIEVMSLKENPLMYRLEVSFGECTYFTNLDKQTQHFVTVLKASDSDKDVNVMIVRHVLN